MQTFLPLPDYAQSAQVLDRQRLGKQRVECMQIYNAISRGGGWSRHPAVLMWKGHEGALLAYGAVVCQEWKRRGYQDKLHEWFVSQAINSLDSLAQPEWFGDERLHSSHRSNLLRKDPTFYGQYGWAELPGQPYYWPVRN
jgi:Pyrimidine dimer DNA glycosylase